MAVEEPAYQAPRSAGLFVSLKNLAATFVGTLQTRLELLVTELEEERVRLVQIWLLVSVALFLFALGIITLTLFLIVLFWDTQRLLVIGLLTVVYLGAGTAFGLAARNKAAGRSRLFASSLAELAKDRERLTGQ